MQEQKRPILSIKRKPSLMYQKPPQKPDSEQSAAQPEQQAATVTTIKAKPKYKGLPGWEEVRGKFSDGYFNLGKMLSSGMFRKDKQEAARQKRQSGG
ncbi:hypothetical protein AA471_27015 [Salmonella enterica subsp. enterica]|nr:hypothetical protein [Salmonella enterica subsp. enterica]ECI0980873.1 hypothetical protein [Salmonella enterica subsp. enterica serovar Newport]ECI2309635.1 hypothetical protein [Salmonella enterica subsp. enterica serovar Infantis]ECO0902178.1 hypothetical protein [Salmonella enterica subsp. enterica serovar Newport]ECO1013696.1 hypothetical protein [Salmonella enterica subsp. enterica serovar Newport]